MISLQPFERLVAEHLTAHEGHWGHAAFTLRALNTDEDAGRYLRGHVRDCMAAALYDGFEGREETPKRPGIDHHRKATVWVGMQLLRDIGPRGLSEIRWVMLGGELTRAAGIRICDRRPKGATT